MAIGEENGGGMVMPVSPMGGYGGGYGFGDNGWWIILLFILLGNNGWGGYGNGGTNFVDSSVQRGFDQSAIMSGLGDINSTINSAQMADMNRSFDLQSQLASCCCENRLATADLKYTIATEECATRNADAVNTRDIIDSQTRGTQAIMDKLCQLELDGVKGQLAQAERENLGLQNQLNIATVQNGMNSEVDALYNRLKNCPVPSMPVYGTQPIFTCGGNNNGCGCGCGSF